MILEDAGLEVAEGQESEFEAAFAESPPLIAVMPGFVDLTLSRWLEPPNRNLLLLHWQRYYDPLPAVDHFASVVGPT